MEMENKWIQELDPWGTPYVRRAEEEIDTERLTEKLLSDR